MMVRQGQFEHLEKASAQRFEDKMASHIGRCFPKFAVAGPLEVQALIREGLTAARKYGFSSQRDVCHYIDLMLVFGPSFDCDPRHRWANEILADRRFKDPSARMDHLYDSARRYRRA